MISLTSPVKTRAHDWPAGLKLLGLCAATVALFMVKSTVIQACVLAVILAVYAWPGKVFLMAGLRLLRVLWPFVVIVGLWHTWTNEIELGGAIIFRMLNAVALANLVTMTTRLSDMIDVVQALASPLARLGLKPRILELAIALVIRLIPVLVLRGHQLRQAWRARSRRAPGWNIILPFTVLALDDADHVAEALRARGGFNTLEKT